MFQHIARFLLNILSYLTTTFRMPDACKERCWLLSKPLTKLLLHLGKCKFLPV